MAKGESGIGSNAISKEAAERVKGMSGYHVSGDGIDLDFYFQKVDGETYVSNNIGDIPEPTPNNWTEKEMIDALKQNGSQVEKYSKSQLINQESERIKYRQQTNDFLNNEYARNSGADIGAKIYRNTKKAQKIARRK